ncbi:MAG: ATP-dependent RNA helicase DeaD [Alphaproteobacteria bacterium]|jgi:ATP-dependent RNA helicase DeaD
MTEFAGVVPPLQQALSQRGYTQLTPVQTAVLAPELRDADALVSAQTGSGKTVAFGMALAPTLLDGADRFVPANVPVALVVAPTRELALQVKRELEWLYALTGAGFASCVGGMDMRTERQALQRGAHIVVGTPGRLRDHIERGSFNTTGLKAVVLDEADEMLDLGFRDDLEYILDAAPKSRRTLMFSATVPRSIATLAKRYQRDAVRVATSAEHQQHVDIEYRALTVAPNDRENAIVNVLRYFDAKNALVFCATRATVNRMTSRFANRGFSAVALSGELSQSERTHALQALRDGRARVCIATDVAARGLDLPNLELVIHADIPKNRESLLHRSGRTGRAGRKGVCALIVPYNLRRRTEMLLKSANVEATWAKPPSVYDILQRDRERILTDPALSEPVTEDERAFVQEILTRHGAEQVAAAFLRQHLGDQTAPEELLDTAPADEPKKRRDDFKGGVWFSLSVGREQRAEARWLLPMLCRAGHITKEDIGAIRINEKETHVELAPGCVDRFLETVGPSRKMEKTITVTRLPGSPKVSSGKPGGRSDKPYAKKKPYTSKTDGGQARPERKRTFAAASGEPGGRSDKPYAKKKPYTAKTEGGQARPERKRTFAASTGEPAAGEKRWEKTGKRPNNKKSKKVKLAAKLAKGSSKGRGVGKTGSTPVKRKKLQMKTD